MTRPGDGVLARYVRALDVAFRAPNKHLAQEQARNVLLDMAADERALRATVARHLSQTESLNTKNFPSLGFEISTTPHYALVANAFFPHPRADTDVTCNSVHHHGEMLLTTVTAFGSGYEHWRFTTPEVLDPQRHLFRIALVDRELHKRGHASFVDAYMPHAVMFPRSLTLTYALWSSRRRVRWTDHVKRWRLFRGREKALRAVAVRLGLRRALDLKVARYFDYYPVDGGFCGMRERQQFERGSNEDYLQNLFFIMQQTQCDDLAVDIERHLGSGRVMNVLAVRRFLEKLRRGEPMAPRFSDRIHMDIPHMNFKSDAILRNVSARAPAA